MHPQTKHRETMAFDGPSTASKYIEISPVSAMEGVMSTLLRSFVIGLAFAMATVTSTKSAVAMTYDNIIGTWCGAKTNPNWTNQLIARTTLTIVHLPENSKVILKIDHFEFTDTNVTIHYYAAPGKQGGGTPGNKLTQVMYGDFSADGKTMVQGASGIAGTGQYHFTRC
jgi:hypothetical protein